MAGDLQRAMQVYKHMTAIENGNVPDLFMFNNLLYVCVRNNHIETAEFIFNEMMRFKIEPDLIS